jgi:hypothetical protein
LHTITVSQIEVLNAPRGECPIFHYYLFSSSWCIL